MYKLTIENMSKRYGDTVALDSVSLTLEEGKIYGLLGRNGAGKTTLLNCLTNFIFPNEGDILLDGEKPKGDELVHLIYKTSERTYYPESMRCKEVLRWTKNFYPQFDMEYAIKLAGRFELNLKKKVDALSTGMNSILKLIIALSVNTPFIFLDEPVLGLDAGNREEFYKILLEKYSEKPFGIVLSTHLIEEAAPLIEDVIILNQGKIIQNTTCEELLSRGYTISGPAEKVDDFIKGRRIIGEDRLGGLKTAYILGKREKELPQGLEVSRMDLQKLFVQLTGTEGGVS